MTGTMIVLLTVLTAELMMRKGLTPLRTLAQAASGDKVLR